MINIAVLGAKGLIGNAFLQILSEENNISLKCFGKDKDFVSFKEKEIEIFPLDKINFNEFDLIFGCLDAETTLQLKDEILKSNAIFIDKSSAFRANDDIPLIIADVNISKIKESDKIISSPNCNVIPISIFLNAIKKFGFKNLAITTMQSVSGAGTKAMHAFFREIKASAMHPVKEGMFFDHPMAFNLITAIGDIDENDNISEEELKIKQELNKIFEEKINISVTTVRVPVTKAHTISLTFELKNFASIKDIKKEMQNSGIEYSDKIVTPLMIEHEDCVFASRLRHDYGNVYSIVLLCNNLRKGGALNAIEIAKKIGKL